MNKQLALFILFCGLSSHAFGMLSSMCYGAAFCRATMSAGRASIVSLLSKIVGKKPAVITSKASSVPFFTRVKGLACMNLAACENLRVCSYRLKDGECRVIIPEIVSGYMDSYGNSMKPGVYQKPFRGMDNYGDCIWSVRSAIPGHRGLLRNYGGSRIENLLKQ